MLPAALAVPAAVSLLGGVLGVAGQDRTNAANARQAKEQMAFQERMSNTAAQRSIADYRAAGLNPALAYERTASSPSGASAVMGNAIASGLSSAADAARLNQELRQSSQIHYENLRNTRANTEKTRVEGANAILQGDILSQERRFRAAIQPHEQRLRAAEALMMEYGLAGEKNKSDVEKMMGRLGPGMTSARGALDLLLMGKELTPLRRIRR